MTELLLEAAIAALTHAGEINQLLLTAKQEGRDVTPEEVVIVMGRAQASVDRLEALKKP